MPDPITVTDPFAGVTYERKSENDVPLRIKMEAGGFHFLKFERSTEKLLKAAAP